MKDYLELSDEFLASVSGGMSEDEETIYENFAKPLLAQLKAAWSQATPEAKQEIKANSSYIISTYRNVLQFMPDELFQLFESELQDIINNL